MPPQSESETPLPEDSQIISLDDVRNPYVRKGVSYWQSLRGDRQFPARSELTLRGTAAILPYVVIIAVIDDGADYEYRYVGDAQRQSFRVHFQGMRLSQIEALEPRLGFLLRSAYDLIRATRMPLAVRGHIGHEPQHADLAFHETVFLPLGMSDASVDHLLIVGVYAPLPFWEITDDKLALLAQQIRNPAAFSESRK